MLNGLLKPILVIAAACFMAAMFICTPSTTFAEENDGIIITDIKFTPSTLNMKSRGKFITAHVTLPEEYSDELPQPEDVTLNILIGDNETGDIVALRTARDYFGEVVVKFSRSDIQDLIAENIDQFPATVELSLTIAIDNEALYGTDNIRVIMPGKKGKGGKGNGN